MLIESQELPPIGTNAFALVAPTRGACVIVDAPLGAYEWATGVAAKHGCSIEALVLTHGHWDHTLDGYKFVDAGVPVYGHPEDRSMFTSPELMASYAMPGLEMNAVAIEHWIEGGDALTLLGERMEVRHVPGHCPGNILLYVPGAQLAMVGDAIFAGSVGRYDLPGGDFATLEHSIQTQVYTLPEATVLYPGHGPQTTVGHERETNPFIRP